MAASRCDASGFAAGAGFAPPGFSIRYEVAAFPFASQAFCASFSFVRSWLTSAFFCFFAAATAAATRAEVEALSVGACAAAGARATAAG